MTQERVAELLKNLRSTKFDLLPDGAWDVAIKALEQSARSEAITDFNHKTGKWEKEHYASKDASDHDFDAFRCSVCTRLCSAKENYCPTCGTRMLIEEDDRK